MMKSQGYFDTSSIEATIDIILKDERSPLIIIKSTVPLGYTNKIKKKFSYNRIIFSPEFLREGKALYDNLNPSRIVVGDTGKDAKVVGQLLLSIAKDKKYTHPLYGRQFC